LFGIGLTYFLHVFNPVVLEILVRVWSERLLLGMRLFGVTWFILNNVLAMFLLLTACFLILIWVTKTPEYYLTKVFKRARKYRARLIWFGLRLIPMGALFVNSFLITLLLSWVWLKFGSGVALNIALLLLPHGLNELIALVLATSLVLAYLHVLSPFVLAERWKEAARQAKSLLVAKPTLVIALIILAQLTLSGAIEGVLMVALS
jgi:hypothetical protein